MTEKASKKRRKALHNVTQSETSPAAELIANNFDLLTEILIRLPSKLTIRFKSVSKHWLYILSDSEFARKHSSRNPRPTVLGLHFYIDETLNFVSLDGLRGNLPSLSFLDCLLKEPSTIRVTHSCNGLLLCYIRNLSSFERRYVVCNVTTRRYTIIPEPNGSDHGPAYLAFDPSKSPHYKVLLVCSSFYQVDVYCSQSACWRKVFPNQKCYGHSVFWNGAIHWLTDANLLLRLDANAEEIVVKPNPQLPKILPQNKIKYFGECGGDLILIQSRSRYPSGFRILKMERDYSGWVVKCQVNLRPLIAEFPDMESRSYYNRHGFKVLYCAAKGDNEKDLALVLAIPLRIISYNVKYKTWDVLRHLAFDERIDFAWKQYAYPFIETLFPV